MGSVIDSSVIIAIERGSLEWAAVMAEVGTEPGVISAVTVSELMQGVHRTDRKGRAKREAFVAHVLDTLPAIAFDSAIAMVHSEMAADLQAKGTPVGAHDLLIGATAKALGYRVMTRDVRSFPRMPGLSVRVV